MNELIGKPFSEVKKILESKKANYRIFKRDGINYMLTHDCCPTRINLAIENDIVTEIKYG